MSRLPSSALLHGLAVYLGAGDLNSGLYVCIASTLYRLSPLPIPCLETLSSTRGRGRAATEHVLVQTLCITTSGFCIFRFMRWLKFICNLPIRIPGAPVAVYRCVQNRKMGIARVYVPH